MSWLDMGLFVLFVLAVSVEGSRRWWRKRRGRY